MMDLHNMDDMEYFPTVIDFILYNNQDNIYSINRLKFNYNVVLILN